jgi:hypothetical protein
MITWKKLLEAQLKHFDDTLVSVYAENTKSNLWADDDDEPIEYTEANHLNIPGLLVRFDSSYGGTNGPKFTAWGLKRVYFPAQYDGSEWVASVPRNPCEQVTDHVGGG